MIWLRLSLPALAFAWLAPALAFADTPAAIEVDLGAGVKLGLVLVSRGTFMQGSPPSEAGRSEDERARPVTLGNDVYIGKFPVTRGQFARFVAATGYRTEAEKGTSGGSGWDGSALVQRRDFTWKSPGFAQTDEHPVTIVTYDDALAFTGWLTRTSGRAFTLPTEAQWEYAYRAGSTGAYYAAKSEGEALALGWFKPNAGNGTRPVGQRKPNPLGLHDLAGNVNEWCLDWYAAYGAGPAVDPVATAPDPADTPRRVLRGGSWLKAAKGGRAAARFRNTPGSRNADNGFRVAADTRASAPAPLPASPPAESIPPTISSDKPTSTANKVAGAFIFSGVCFGTIAFVGFLLMLIGRSRKKAATLPAAPLVGSRLARDGFWIDAPGHLVGSLVSYRYRAVDGSMHDGQVRVEGAPSGQYVYTGHAPSTVLALQIIGMSSEPARPSRSSWSAERHYGDTSTSSDDVAPFVGYPSAY